MRRLKCFGLKCAICCCILSAWGIIQLGIMGVLFHIRSVAFLDDVPEVEIIIGSRNLSYFYSKVEAGYDANAINCWVGASLYCMFLIFSLFQYTMSYLDIQSAKN